MLKHCLALLNTARVLWLKHYCQCCHWPQCCPGHCPGSLLSTALWPSHFFRESLLPNVEISGAVPMKQQYYAVQKYIPLESCTKYPVCDKSEKGMDKALWPNNHLMKNSFIISQRKYVMYIHSGQLFVVRWGLSSFITRVDNNIILLLNIAFLRKSLYNFGVCPPWACYCWHVWFAQYATTRNSNIRLLLTQNGIY